MSDHLHHLDEAREAIVEIACADGIARGVAAALKVAARDMQRSLEAIEKLISEVAADWRKAHGIKRKTSPAA
jgi:hypothetical protein